MLTMIAQTMLPEAYFKGGSIIGFSTLLGFLAAIFLKTLERIHAIRSFLEGRHLMTITRLMPNR